MHIRCPHCNFDMELKGAKPGRFHPRCTGCKEKFQLQIFPEEHRAPVVAKEHDPKAETLLPQMTDAKTQAAKPAPSTVQTAAPAAVAAHPPTQQLSREIAHDDFDSQLVGTNLGGYRIMQKLGAGGMGSVYLARQLSLDRDVALKLLSPTLASEAQFVARFTREAYAAAQLSHHNVVQIHDIGEEHDLHFFSMEFVEGETLAKLVEEHKQVDPEQAVGFILQAARGLKYAHERGLIHRDVKPENLMLNEQGVVKVADLGLVKRAGFAETNLTGQSADSSGKTQANMSMGTPAYMSPEQSIDAAKVDQRADIYSLGCTMYDLLTGRPPFVGRTAMEVITKHQREQIVPPDLVVKDVPKSLSAILLKMAAKKPEERYQTMDEVIKALEDFLGLASTGPFTPKEEHVKVLEFAVARFNQSTWRMIRNLSIAIFFLICALLAVFVGATRETVIAKAQFTGAFIGLAILTTISYFIITGVTQRTVVFLKTRQLVFGANLTDWIVWTLAICAAVFVLHVFGQLLPWLIVAGIAVLLAAGFHFTIDLALSRERSKPIEQTEAMLKTMRLRGLDENSLRQFVSRYSGKHWEEFYETLFGYQAKLQARSLWGRTERARERPRFAAWRDPVIRAIETRLSFRRELRERRILTRVEAKALRSKGIRDDLAMKQARTNARDLVRRAEKLRGTSIKRAAKTVPPVQANRDVALESAIAQILGGASEEEAGIKHRGGDDDEWSRQHESWFKRRYGSPIDLILSQLVRLILAAIMLSGFTLWWQQNGGQRAAQQASQVVDSRREIPVEATVDGVKRTAQNIGEDAQKFVATAGKIQNKPLHLFPGGWDRLNRVSEFFGDWNAGLAGFLLLISSFFIGRVMSVVVILSAMIAMMGHRFGIVLPVIDSPIAQWMSAAAAVLVWIFGVMFFREREGY